MTKTESVYIPYKGAAPAFVELIAGQVTMYFSSIPPALPHIKNGRVRAHAIGRPEMPFGGVHVLARWLEQFAGEAGGALFNIQVGNAEPALARIYNELSSYYLLGVEPADEDRDGRTHEVAVKIREPNLTIRGRRWVTIPKRGTTAAASTTPGPTADAPEAAAER